MAVYTQKLTPAERISQTLLHLSTIAKNVVAMKKLEQEKKQEKDLKTVELINKALPGQGVQAVPMEVGGQQLPPNVLPGDVDLGNLGITPGMGSPALPENAIQNITLNPQGELVRTPIAPPPLPEGFTYMQVPRQPTDVELLEPSLRLKEKIGREYKPASEIPGTPEWKEALRTKAGIEREFAQPKTETLTGAELDEKAITEWLKENPGKTYSQGVEWYKGLGKQKLQPFNFYEYFFGGEEATPSDTTQKKRLKYNPATGKSE